MNTGESEEPELLEVHIESVPAVQRPPDWRWLLLVVGLVIVGGVVLLRTGQGDEQSTPTTEPDASVLPTTTERLPDSVPARSSLRPLTKAIGHSFVAADEGDYLVVLPDLGLQLTIETEAQILATASGGVDHALLFRSDGVVERVLVGAPTGETVAVGVRTFQPTAEHDGAWISLTDTPGRFFRIDHTGTVLDEVERDSDPVHDPRYRYEVGGGTYALDPEPMFLGPHQLLAAGPDELIGRICDASAQCILEWWNAVDGWAGLQVPAGQVDAVEAAIDPTGTWAVVVPAVGVSIQVFRLGENSLLSVGRSDAESALDVAFTGTGTELVIFNDDRLRVIDLGVLGEESIDLVVGTTQSSHDWVAVPMSG